MKALLHQVQTSALDFVTTFDFRDQPRPDMRLLGPVFADFYKKLSKAWTRRSTPVALVIRGNVFSTVANGAMAKFVEVCGLDVCPMVMCHEDSVAIDFFRHLVLGDTDAPSISSFVSVMGPRDVGTRCYSFLCQAIPSSQSNSGIGRGSDLEDPVKAPRMSMHMLDNGDLRIIQSPPSDLMVMNEVLTKPQVVQPKPPAGSDRQNAIEGVFFRCTARTMKKLVGISFSLVELVIDADSESCFQKGEDITANGIQTKFRQQAGGRKGQHAATAPTSGPCGRSSVSDPRAREFRKAGCLSGAWLALSLICS